MTSLKLVQPHAAPATDDLRVRAIRELAPPSHLIREFPCSPRAAETASASRQAIHGILNGRDDRLLVVVGPCSIHDAEAALDYAQRLSKLRQRLGDELEVVVRREPAERG